MRRHLVPAAREWERRAEPDDELYRGARLAAALDWAAEARAKTSRRWSSGSCAARGGADAELTDARERCRARGGARRRTRRLAAGLAAVLVVALVATFSPCVPSGRPSARRSRAGSLVADANRLAALSRTAVGLDLSYLLAAQAFRLEGTPEA